MKKQRHILLAITGLAPQVVTETLYALYQSGKTIPARIIIITTQIGANEAKKHLVEQGKIQQFCDDYGIPPIKLDAQDIYVIPDKDGQVFSDINAQKQMNILADFICNKVRELAADHNNIIHASLAGGRKTMTYFLGMAMSLYGREGDTLSHVLVSEGYELSKDFFYPTPYSYNITARNGSLLDAQYAKVVLTTIPFVRLRSDFPQKLLDGSASYTETIDWLNYETDGQLLTLNIKKRQVTYCGEACQMPAREFAFYHWFCHRRQLDKQGLHIPDKKNKKYADQYKSYYFQHFDCFAQDEKEKTMKKEMSKNFFEETKSRINGLIDKAFGERIGAHIHINKTTRIKQRVLVNGHTRIKEKFLFAITLTPKLIIITED